MGKLEKECYRKQNKKEQRKKKEEGQKEGVGEESKGRIYGFKNMGDHTERLKTIIGREGIRTYRKGGKSVEQKVKERKRRGGGRDEEEEGGYTK